MIFVTCFQILKQVYHSIVEFHRTEVTTASFAVLLITIGVNAFVAVYESRKGEELKSEFLTADAMHTKNDILVSVAVIASLIFTRAGYRFADAVVGIVIAFLIARIGYEIIKRASDVLVDTICINTTALEGVIKSVKGVRGCHDIRTRGTEHSINLDVHILVNPKMSIEKAHEVADSVEEKIKSSFPAVTDIVVHIEPEGNDCK
jgi:cation diffusion facilitator family transporter